MRKTGEAYYGIYLQLWDVFPLRYIRTLLVEWRHLSKFEGSNIQKKREHLEKLTKEAAKENAGPTGKAFAPQIHMQTIKWEADGQAFMWLSHPDVYRVALNGTCEKSVAIKKFYTLKRNREARKRSLRLESMR